MSGQGADAPKAYHVPNLEGLFRASTGLAAAAGIAAVAVALLTDLTAFAVFLGLIGLTAIVGSALFGGVHKTVNATSAMAEDRVLAQGVGRGGRGFLGAHVVAVTDRSIVSVSAKPWGVGQQDAAIRLSEVSSVTSGIDFLQVADSQAKISLRKASPLDVEAILGELRRRRVGSGVDQASP